MALDRVQAMAEELISHTPSERVEWLVTRSRSVAEGAPQEYRFMVIGTSAPVYICGSMAITGDWQFQVYTDMVVIRGLFYIIQEVISGLSTDQIIQITYRDLEPVTRLLHQGHQRNLQAMLNQVIGIISG